MREEYPREDYKRENYEILNGKWDFKFDDLDQGVDDKWFENFPSDSVGIIVPFAYQTKLSKIGLREKHDIIWYNKKVKVKKGRSELHFGAVDYECDVYIDGQHMVNHIGGEVEFAIPLKYENDTEITITLRVYDPLCDEEILRGKQMWEEKSRGIWYTPTSGIWQTVWIDYVGDIKILDVKSTSDVDTGIQNIKVEIEDKAINKKLRLEVQFEGKVIYNAEQIIYNKNCEFSFDMYNNQIFKTPFHSGGRESVCWSPEHPRLFDIKIEIIGEDTKCIDRLYSYFGFRKISFENGMTYLNNNPYYFKFVLDQGYWADGLLTAPSDEDFIKDIELSKQMGFNGCRKHQKVEDPRFLYWADKLGFLVWGEVSSAPVFTSKAVKRMQTQWFDIIDRDYNHPSIVAWVPLNESWGVPFIKFDEKQQAHSMSLYYQLKSIDNSRLVVNNDGWEQTKTDICAIHNYNHGRPQEAQKVKFFEEVMSTKEKLLSGRAAGKPVYANGYEYEEGTPIMITEFGGIAYDKNHPDGWGYTSVTSSEDLLLEYSRIIKVFEGSSAIYGYVYTQLCDVEQEVNGLLTYDRKPKCKLEDIKKVNDSIFIKY